MVQFDHLGTVVGYATNASAAETTHGVAVGDALATVARRYTGMQCGGVVLGQAEHPSYRSCVGRLATGGTVWFGGDPIDSVWIYRDPSLGRETPPHVMRPRRR